MSEKLNVVTGATGQLGSHIVEQLRGAGERVRAIARRGSDTAFLRRCDVELVEADLADAAALQSAVAGASIVYHCAARVSDWGPWSAFQQEVVANTRNLVDACKAEKVGRMLHVSSISVYGHPKIRPGEQITEAMPLGQNYWLWDYYPRAKVLAEREAERFGPDLTIVRPSWIYGPRDRITIPRVVPALKERRVPIIGSGANLLNIVYAGDVAAGAILAANEPGARGEAYNLCSEGEVSQQDLINSLTDTLGVPRVARHVPYFLAMRFAFMKELIARMLRREKPPTVTRRAIYLIGRSTNYSIEKAKGHLGWEPRIKIGEGVRLALRDYFSRSGQIP